MTVSELHKACFHELETDRLRLRPLVLEDAGAMFEYTSVPENFRFLRREPHRSPEEDEAFIQNVLEGYRQHREFVWGISLKETGRLIGTCRLFDFQMEAGSCEVSYMLHPQHQRRGITSEAVGRLIRYAFEELEFHEVFARCAASNTGSEQVMRKCGMKREAFLPHEAELHGVWCDFLLYAIKKSEVTI